MLFIHNSSACYHMFHSKFTTKKIGLILDLYMKCEIFFKFENLLWIPLILIMQTDIEQYENCAEP